MCLTRVSLSYSLADFVTRIQRHLTSRPQDCAGNSGPNCNTLCSTQPVQGNEEICGWAHSFWFGTLHHPLSLKKLKMYVYFFTNPASSPFKDFAEKYGFDHVTSSPLYPQSNGLAEKGVQIAKRILKKAAENAEDPHLAILNYRASPLENGLSPAEMLMNRKLRTRLPSATHQRESVFQPIQV